MSSSLLRVMRLSCLLGLGLFGLAALAGDDLSLTLDPNAAKAGGWAITDDVRIQVLVQLTEPAAATVFANSVAHKSLSDPRVRQAAASATQASVARIQSQQNTAAVALAQLGAREIYRVARAANGIAVAIRPDQLSSVRHISNVLRVLPIPRETPSLSTSVPFIGAPAAWGNTLGLPQNITGSGMRIGIIDTGIDYLHPDFGGSGVLADYQANDGVAIAAGAFPTAKVVGGTDFAGDAYNGSNTATPDANPLDCNGHGTHVAGIAAGLGTNSDGSTYTGAYSPATPFGALGIGPGVAPQASLYAIRVFGCGGSTSLTVQGIDWALDPNGDNDLSDHLDVINMSLGSDFGDYTTATAVAAENAAAAGVVVVAAAGNAGDTYFIGSSPASSGRTISTAAIADPGVPGALLTVNSPAPIAGGYAAAAAAFTPAPPAPSGQTANIVQALDAADAAGPLTTDGCSAFTNAAAVAGNIALIDRGTCGFIVKVQNAQAAGAIGAIVVGNVTGDPNPISMGGAAPPGPAVTIPSIYISQADGNTIKAALSSGVNATLTPASAADTMASFSSRGPRLGAAPTRLKPDISAPGVNITSAQSGKTCITGGCLTPTASGYDAGSQALTISGTSMATPHMAGTMALLRELHPDWSVEQLKALAMNGALHDPTLGANGSGLKYGAARVGAGRVDVADAATATVVALNGEDTGLVNVSFETAEVVGTATEVKKVRVVNTGTSAQTFDLSINTLVAAPGVTFSLPGGAAISVPAGGSVAFDVQMDANAAQMKHTREATVSPFQAAPAPLTSLGNLARHWLTDQSSLLVLSQAGNAKLRLPLYAAARAASTMSAPASIVTGGAPTGSTNIALSGNPVCTGTLAAGPTCTGNFPTDEMSLVTPFELQVVSPRDATVAPAFADLQYGGVAYDSTTNLILFGVSTWGDWSTPTDVAFNIYIDNNSDGTWDRVLFNTNPGTAAANLFGTAGVTGQDAFVNLIFNLSTNGVSVGGFLNRLSPATIDSVLFKNNVMFLAATPAQLGLAAGVTKFKYKIQTCAGSQPLCGPINGTHYDEAAGPYTFDYAAQGLNFGGASDYPDLNGGSLAVTWNTANLTTNGSLGALLLHHHNVSGSRAELVTLDTVSSLDLAITQSVAPTTPTLGQNATFTIAVSNAGGPAANGVQVTDLLPAGLTYVSDDSGGSYDQTTGNWSVGALAVGAGATLHVVATVASTDKTCNPAQITAVTPLDTNPSNNQASVCVMAPRSTDLALSMSVSSPTVLAGGSVSYTLGVKNNGGDTAYSLNVQDAFPAFPALQATSAAPSQGVFDASTGLWNIGSLANGASATLTLTVTAPNTAGPLTSQGTASASTSDPNTGNNTAMATTTVLSPAVLSATKTVSGSFTPNGNISYTIVISNSASFDQQDNPGHEFSDVLPAQLTLLSATATSGTASSSGNTVDWDGVVPANGSVTLTINASIAGSAGGQTISNQGTVNYDGDGNGTNETSVLTNDPGQPGTGNATAFVVLSPASLSASKSVSGTFVPGGTVTYSIVISNAGPNPQLDNPGHEFTDVLPPQLTLVSATANAGTPATSGNTVTWDGAVAVGSGSEITITIVATVNAGSGGETISNQGTLSYDADGNGTNESTTVTSDPAQGSGSATSFVVLSPASVSASKTVSGVFKTGNTVTYSVVLANAGPNAQLDNPGHEFVDVLPAQLTLLTANASAGTIATSGNTVDWDGAIGVGAANNVTITITATINSGKEGQVVSNQATVNFDGDGNGSNESSTLSDDPALPGIADPTRFTVARQAIAAVPVPMIGEFGRWLLVALVLLAGLLLTTRQRARR